MIKSVCVYCGSSDNVDPVFKKSAAHLGGLLAAQGWDVVYGGGHVGLMGIVADAALAGGSKVIGILPDHIRRREKDHESLTELHIVETMHERKQMMVDRADGFIIMPGGTGTMDEFFEILTWKQLDLHDKPIVLVNDNGYWTNLVALIDHMIDAGFMRQNDRDMFHVAQRPEDAVEFLKNAPLPEHGTSSQLI